MLVGSYSFFKCIRKRGKTAATLARKLMHKKQQEKEKAAKEQRLPELGEEGTSEEHSFPEETKTEKKKKKKKKTKSHAKVHPIMV